ncbi:X2-like carbohydrate binding domain-containing protein [Paenibacillus tarimensis]|uniref:X2-like carbohydrate binding domain-containing protein n=1 Tax=Paenibacillus tarimensis TaxID=416012 RepID=UPI001F2EEB95|nr:X2-like carbohydrate binding domain-containing protein [Paenibacillus tarimensis]MCF2944063.1 xyloglucanase [Paenibacillus tarimensis]
MKLSKTIRKAGILLTLAAVFAGTTIVSDTKSVKAAPSEPYTWKNVVTGAGGGFIPGIIFNKTEKDLIYTRTDIGGAYRWNPADNSWIPLLDFVGWDEWGKTGVDALATDPVDPDRLYLAVGTYTNDWDPNNGYIMRSTDRGDTWQETELPFKVGGNMPGRSMGERLAIDPNSNNILYFGARSGNGLWKSIDYGATWNKVTSFPNPGTYVQDPSNSYQSDIMGLAWITFDPATGSPGSPTQTIYIGVADKETSIYRSTDGGATWSAVPGQPSGFLPHHGELDSSGNLFITYNDAIGPYDGEKGDVWRYNTVTGEWTNVSPVPSSSTDNYFGYGGLALDEQQPGTLMVSALNSWWPDTILFRSTDSGATWTRIWDWAGYPNRTLRYTQDISAAPWLDFGTNPQPPEVTPKLGWMVGDLEIDPHNSNRMMYGTGATIYGTNNLTDWDADKKINISVMAKGLEEISVIDLISPPSGAPLLSGVGDVSGFRHDDVTKAPAKMFIGPSSTASIDYAELNPTFIARVGYGDYENNPNAKSIALSYDGGTNWFNPSSEPAGTKGGGTLAVGADNSSLVWSTPDVGVYYSKSSGNSWMKSTGLPDGAKVASDRVNKNKFYAAAAGAFYVSTDGGATFTQTAAAGLPAEGALKFKAMPGVEGDIWLAGGSESSGVYGLWHSTDSGASFTKLANVEEADVVGFGKAAPGQTYMALYISAQIDGVRGIFRSDDAGLSWVRINDDKHQYAYTGSAITGDPRIYGRVYVGTNGRGIVYGDLAGPVQNHSSITPAAAAFDKKAGSQADVTVTITPNGNTLTAVRNGSKVLAEGLDYTAAQNKVTIKSSYLAAQPLGTLSLTFDFSAGTDPVLEIAIEDSTSAQPVNNSSITPVAAAFDKKAGSQTDVTVTITPNGNTLTAVRNVSKVLVEGQDYTIDENKVTIKSSYLAAQPLGTLSLTFDFSAGTDPVLEIAVSDSTAAEPGSVKAQMFNGSTSSEVNTLNPRFKLMNTGAADISLADVKIRYYYTIDGEQEQSFWCDWSTAGSGNVTAKFVKMASPKDGADHYVEIGFSSGAGILPAGQSIDIQTRIAKNNWSSYSQTGDYSFNGSASSYTDWSKTTVYTAGSLQWGQEPQ